MLKIQHIICWAVLIAGLFTFPPKVSSQSKDPESFQSPLEIPLVLSGNFGELRSNHFHGGLDFKTNGQSGYNVLASSGGYISRIKVDPGGYGYALYLQHPDGYSTVYGHLMKFRKDIAEYVKIQQYKKESFSVDLYPDPGLFSIKQGDLIALSGNSGSSQAPHLHFEIRDSQTQNPVNPLQFNFKVNDHTPPLISSVYLYSLNGRKDLKSHIKINAVGGKGHYRPRQNIVYPMDAMGGIGIETIDYLDDANNPCGINQIELFVDEELISRIKIDEFSFSESKYINSCIDYEEYYRTKKRILKTYIDPNNHISIFEFVKNRGKVILKDDEKHLVKLVATDSHKNQSEIEFVIQKNESAFAEHDYSKAFYSAYFSYAETNRFEAEDFEIYISPNTLYDDLYFNYETDSIPLKGFSKIHKVHQPTVALHRPITIKIRPETLPKRLKSKALIAKISESGGMSAVGGSWEGDWLKASSSSFGNFTIAVDTIAPYIRSLDLSGSDPAIVGNNIRFKISDNFSGIRSFRGTLNGEWILFEYDSKSGTLNHTTDPYLFPSGEKLELVLRVSDRVGNTKEFRKSVIRK